MNRKGPTPLVCLQLRHVKKTHVRTKCSLLARRNRHRKIIDYVLSKPGQEKFAEWGYRPVSQEVLAANKSKFPDPPGLFTIDDLGGWSKVNTQMFDPEKGSVAKIEDEAGVSTAK